jgi:hypothetical protein
MFEKLSGFNQEKERARQVIFPTANGQFKQIIKQVSVDKTLFIK